MARILIIDDDPLVGKSLGRVFGDMGHHVDAVDSIYQGLKAADNGFDVIYLDLDLPDGDGLKYIDELAGAKSHPEIIVITGMGASYGAQKTMESCAWDYISKPASPQVVIAALESALEYRVKAKKNVRQPSQFLRRRIVGNSPATLKMLEAIETAAASDAAVLVRGETGVGKELAARALHENSLRHKAPFVIVDCSNLTESLVESTLYGHIKGSFTDARSDRHGLIAQADGGTLFLDEIGELPPVLQKSFLRVLQERKYRPVGSNKEYHSDFRLVAATNRNLDNMLEHGRFRSDLLFRLRTIEIIIPPLRERKQDIAELTVFFLKQTCERYGIDAKEVSRELLRVAGGYEWPGNIREMQNSIEAAVIQSGTDPIIYPKHLPANVRMAFLTTGKQGAAVPTQRQPVEATSPAPGITELKPYNDYRRERDRDYFEALMEAADRDIPAASRISGLSIPSIYRHLSSAGIETKRTRRTPKKQQ